MTRHMMSWIDGNAIVGQESGVMELNKAIMNQFKCEDCRPMDEFVGCDCGLMDEYVGCTIEKL